MANPHPFPLPQNSPLAGKTVMFLTGKHPLPSYQPFKTRQELLQALGGEVADKVAAGVDYLVVGRVREKGRADILRRVLNLQQAGVKIEIIEEESFDYLARSPLEGRSFALAGTFAAAGLRLDPDQPLRAVEWYGGIVHPRPTDQTDYLVIGKRRGPKKTALIGQAEALIARGAGLTLVEEDTFVSLLTSHQDPRRVESPDGLLLLLPHLCHPDRLNKVINWLKQSAYKLFTDLQPDRLSGVIDGPLGQPLYACTLDADGGYACYTEYLSRCQVDTDTDQGVCTHTLMLIVAMVRDGRMEPDQAYQWLRATRGHRLPPQGTNAPPPKSAKVNRDAAEQAGKERAALTLLRYKGALAGEVDWRPLETVPEDYYAF